MTLHRPRPSCPVQRRGRLAHRTEWSTSGRIHCPRRGTVEPVHWMRRANTRRAGLRGHPGRAPEGDPTRRELDGYAFAHWHAGKRSVVLDLAAEEDRDALERLVAGADILLDGTDARS